MSPRVRKYVVFGSLFAIWLALDLWSKHWADTSLADAHHPLPVHVTQADAGKPLAQVVAARLGVEVERAAQEVVPHVRQLPPAVPVAPTDPVFAPDGPAPQAHAWYVFWRQDASLAPRRIDKIERILLPRWLKMALPGTDAGEVWRLAEAHLSDVQFGAWLLEHTRRLDEDRVPEVLAGRMHPVVNSGAALTAEQPVAAGETYLIQHRQIDVAGDWFKLTYAENPGAAFGFLKSLPPDTRHLVFTVLTIVALIVMLGLMIRMPPNAWLINVAMAGILAGALGNFIDRLRYGYVIDFIDMHLGFMHWPTYNVADISISIGVILLMGDMLFNKNSPLVSQPEGGATARQQSASGHSGPGPV